MTVFIQRLQKLQGRIPASLDSRIVLLPLKGRKDEALKPKPQTQPYTLNPKPQTLSLGLLSGGPYSQDGDGIWGLHWGLGCLKSPHLGYTIYMYYIYIHIQHIYMCIYIYMLVVSQIRGILGGNHTHDYSLGSTLGFPI